MPVQHTNRRGEVYHLQAHPRKSGALGYSFARKPTGTPVESIPAGYEIFEEPDDAQVHLRKIKPTKILPTEKQLAEAAVRRFAPTRNVIVMAEGDSLVIYLSDRDEEWAEERGRDFGLSVDEARRSLEFNMRYARYKRMLRFSMMNSEVRQFYAQRWCFYGSIDNWIHLSSSGTLATLLEQYIPHLGQESFYELH